MKPEKKNICILNCCSFPYIADIIRSQYWMTKYIYNSHTLLDSSGVHLCTTSGTKQNCRNNSPCLWKFRSHKCYFIYIK